MIDWEDQGVVLTAAPFGEHGALLTVFTRDNGRYAGIMPGGQSRKVSAALQPGTFVRARWSARIENQLGTLKVEALDGAPSPVLLDRDRLAGMSSVLALLHMFLAERDPHPDLFDTTLTLLDPLIRQVGDLTVWCSALARWERNFLGELGFGLDLSCCALTGETDQLAYVSPRTGRAVTREAGAPWADRLLPLPAVLHTETDAPDVSALLAAFRLTGYFLERIEPMGQSATRPHLPDARDRFLSRLRRLS